MSHPLDGFHHQPKLVLISIRGEVLRRAKLKFDDDDLQVGPNNETPAY